MYLCEFCDGAEGGEGEACLLEGWESPAGKGAGPMNGSTVRGTLEDKSWISTENWTNLPLTPYTTGKEENNLVSA